MVLVFNEVYPNITFYYWAMKETLDSTSTIGYIEADCTTESMCIAHHRKPMGTKTAMLSHRKLEN